jgi:hypothetical protein
MVFASFRNGRTARTAQDLTMGLAFMRNTRETLHSLHRIPFRLVRAIWRRVEKPVGAGVVTISTVLVAGIIVVVAAKPDSDPCRVLPGRLIEMAHPATQPSLARPDALLVCVPGLGQHVFTEAAEERAVGPGLVPALPEPLSKILIQLGG